MASRFISPVFDGGDRVAPADGLQLFFFETGSSTPKNTFTTEAATVANANPVIADSGGVFPDIFITGVYRVQLKDKNGIQAGFGVADPISEVVGISGLANSTDPALGSALVGQFLPAYGGSATASVVLSSVIKALTTNSLAVNDPRFGGVANDATDQATAFNAAISAANTFGGGGVYVPPGVYFFDSAIIPKDNVTLWSDNPYATTLSLRQANISPMNFSLIDAPGDLDGFQLLNIGLRGNESFQATAAVDSSKDLCGLSIQEGFAKNITIDGCYIRDFGNLADNQGGAVVIIPSAGVADSTIRNIRITNNLFGPNKNVPGVYLWSYIPATSSDSRQIYITDNTFEGGGVQNCVYLDGRNGFTLFDVHVDRNVFDITGNIDVCVELNGCQAWTINDNTVRYSTASGTGGGFLIRGGTAGVDIKGGSIVGNSLYHQNSTGNDTAIAVIAFDTGDIQENIRIEGNNISGTWGQAAGNAAVKILFGSRGIDFINNTIDGLASQRIVRAIDIGECSGVRVEGNTFRNCDVVAALSTGTSPLPRQITFSKNYMNSCGSSGGSLVSTVGGAVDFEGFVVRDNQVVNSVAGTSQFMSVNFSAPTGNRYFNNDCDIIELSAASSNDFEYIKLGDGAVVALTDLDATPSVLDGNFYKTANTGATTIIDFDDGHAGQEIYVQLDANTTIDFTASSLDGNGGVDLTGAVTKAIRCRVSDSGVRWLCEVVGA